MYLTKFNLLSES